MISLTNRYSFFFRILVVVSALALTADAANVLDLFSATLVTHGEYEGDDVLDDLVSPASCTTHAMTFTYGIPQQRGTAKVVCDQDSPSLAMDAANARCVAMYLASPDLLSSCSPHLSRLLYLQFCTLRI